MDDYRRNLRPARYAVTALLMAAAVCVGLATRVGSGHAMTIYASAAPAHAMISPVSAPPPSSTSRSPTAPTTSVTAAVPQPSIGITAAPSQPDTTATTAARVPSLQSCCPSRADGLVMVVVNGLTPGMRLTSGGRFVEFSVTLANYTGLLLPQIVPVVAAMPYAGGPGPAHVPLGILQRRDPTNGNWQNVPLAGGLPAVLLSTGAAFVMPPGWMQTVTYRLQLSARDRPGTLQIEAMAVQLIDHTDLDHVAVPVRVATG